MTHTPEILAFAGSLRKESPNKRLVKLAIARPASAPTLSAQASPAATSYPVRTGTSAGDGGGMGARSRRR